MPAHEQTGARVIRTLILEDLESDLELLLRALRRGGFAPDWRCVATGVEYAAAISEPWDVILADYNLPSFTARDALAINRTRGISPPFIIVTGSISEEIAVTCMKEGAADYLLKDRLARLGEAVTNALEQRKLRAGKEDADRALRESHEGLLTANAELAQTVEQLRRAQQEIIKHERLNAFAQMAAGVAHDFNNALMPLLGLSELLVTHPEALDDRHETMILLREMHTAALDAREIVRRLRQIYKPDDCQGHEPVDLAEIIREAVVLTRPRWHGQATAAGALVDVRTEVPRLPVISGHGTELKEMLVNLIVNAVDAMPCGGTLTIRATPGTDFVTVEVEDTGVGMSEDVVSHCMEPFFTTKGRHGTGIGLAVVHGIIQRHHGTITVTSSPGSGTRFAIRLPPGTHPLPAGSGPKSTPAGRPQRILVIDDDRRSLSLFDRILKLDGHGVELAEGGGPALEMFKPDRYDVIITDRAMGGITGDDLVRRLRQIDGRVAVIMATGFGDTMQDTGEKPEGVDAILSKPVTIDGVRRALAAVAPRPDPAV